MRHKEAVWIAKFPNVHDVDQETNVLLEAAGLELGKRAGLIIPDFKVCRVWNRPVLLVRRFDVVPTGRRALLSFRSLLAVDDFPDFVSYADLAEIVRRVSADPRIDVDLLFKQMVVNVCLFNTDDHLQNFSMVHEKAGCRLSPKNVNYFWLDMKDAGICMALIDLIFDMNPWWRDRQSINQDKHIRTFEASKIKWRPPLLKTPLNEDVLHIIKGPRQVGKTTLIKLFIKNLLADDKVSEKNIFFLSTEVSPKLYHVDSSNHAQQGVDERFF